MGYNRGMKIEICAKPLSVNKAWRGGPRYKTSDYNDFENEVGWLLPKGIEVFDGPVEVRYKFYVKNCKMSDADNFIKPITDILVRHGAMKDDRMIFKVSSEKIQSDVEKIEVEILPYVLK